MLKKCDINRNEVSMCIERVAMVTALKEGITKEDALCSLNRNFILAKSEYVDETSASENTLRETKKRLMRKENRIRNLITQYKRGHAIDQIVGGQDKIPPKTLRNCMVNEKSASCLN